MGVALVVAIAALSFAAIFFRLAQPTHPLVGAGIRLAIAAVLLSPFVVRAFRAGRLRPRSVGLAGAAGCFYAVHFGAWVTSLTLTSVAASVTIVTATPLILAVWALAMGRDRPTPRLWVSLSLALVGLVIIGLHDLGLSGDHLLGDALALLGAVAMAGYLLMGRRLEGGLDVAAFSGIATLVGAVLLLGAAAAMGVELAASSTSALGFLLLAALVPQLVGHNLLTWALAHTTPTRVGIATLGEPVGAALIAWIWLGEQPGKLVALGCAVTVLGVLVALWNPQRGA